MIQSTTSETNVPPTPMETMVNERKNCPFDLRQMTYAMGGGKRGEYLLRSTSSALGRLCS